MKKEVRKFPSASVYAVLLAALFITGSVQTVFLTGCREETPLPQDLSEENLLEENRPGEKAFKEEMPEAEVFEGKASEEEGFEGKKSEENTTGETVFEETVSKEAAEEIPKIKEETLQEETESNAPASSYGLGSAPFLQGKNLLLSLFVTTPESGWKEDEKEAALKKLSIAAGYIEEQASLYGAETQLLCDWKQEPALMTEAEVNFPINEDVDFLDALDEEFVFWMENRISYEALLSTYDADGIATCIFVNNPGVSYAIVYDGEDNEKESLVLFSGDYYQKGKEQTPAVYAHELLHVFGAHDLYEEAEFDREVTDYMKKTYPDEIMLNVSGSSMKTITKKLSPVTAYFLGWVEEAEEIKLFPELKRT